MDESDAAFASDPVYSNTLRGILDSGYERDGKYSCCEGKGSELSCKDFSTFCPKAIAGIGKLPDTVADRSVPLKRQAQGDKKVERYRRRDARAAALPLLQDVETYSLLVATALSDARPEIPEALTDRQADATEPLLSIADAAGGDWPEKARNSLVELCTEAQASDQSVGASLLSDIRQVFDATGVARIGSKMLAGELNRIETSPWAKWNHGRPIGPVELAELLRPYAVAPHNIRIGKAILKGYESTDFKDAWNRYAQWPGSYFSVEPYHRSTTPLQGNADAGSNDSLNRYTEKSVAASKCQLANENAACSGVAALGTHAGEPGTEEEL